MSSAGRRSGLQSGSEFGQVERELKRKREEDLAALAVHGGPNREQTVYRDKNGRKLDMLNEMMRQNDGADKRKEQLDQAQYEWGRGVVQKNEVADRQAELLAVAEEPFARTVDNPRMEKMRKEVIHSDDPMADFFRQKKEKEQKPVSGATKKSRSSKPQYSGPNPTPNRFGVRPGYRWDAIDRSNGFEGKVLKKMNEREAFNEDAYKWSVADL